MSFFGGGRVGGGGRGGVGLGGHGRCEQRSEVFVKTQKKKIFFFLGGGGSGWGCQVGYERRIEVFVKIQKIIGGGGVGVRVDVNREVKFLWKFKNFFFFFFFFFWGGGGGGQGGHERRIEVFVII